MKNIHTQVIVVFLIIILLPLTLLGALSYFKSKQIVENQLREDNLKLIREVNNNYFERYLSKLENDVQVLASRIDIERFYTDPGYKEMLFNEWQVYRDTNPYIDYVYVGTEDNRLWVNPRYTAPDGYKCVERPWYITAINNQGRVAWTDAYREASTGVPQISAVKLIENNNSRPISVFSMDISLYEISGVVNELAMGENVEIYILNKNGDVLAHSEGNKNYGSFAENDWVQELLKQDEGAYLRDFGDEKKYVCYTTINNTGWKLLALIPRGHLEVMVAPIRSLTAGIGLISALLAVFLGLALSNKHFINPIMRLIEQADSIRRGKLDDDKFEVNGSVEFQRLSTSIHEMRLSIREKIANLKNSEEKLMEAKLEAERSTQVKSEFLANMSHEIRTPMNGIIGFSNLLMQTQLSPKQMDYITKIKNQSHHLLAIINDILDFSKIEAGKMAIEQVDFNLEEVIENIFGLLENQASLKGLELLAHIRKDVPVNLIGDPLRLQQVLVNLTNNAIKFSEKGNILLRVENLERVDDSSVKIRFSVQDNGIGLTKEQVDRLFDSFSQADTSITRKYGGTGLGLAISKHLIELMGGEIGVTSEFGTGSTFSFVLPLKTQEGSIKTVQRTVSGLKGRRVLVVDDNLASQEILASYLTNMGFVVTVLSSGEEAIDILVKEGQEFDILIIDWKMPGLDGVETIRQINEKVKMEKMPVVIMASAYDLDELKAQLANIGIKALLNKPHTPSQLLDAISLAYSKSDYYFRPKDLKEDSLFKGKLAGNHVLLVEDNYINQQVAGEILKSAGIVVDVAENGKEAIEKLREGNYALVLMDLQMPVMDGMEATRLLRSDPQYQKLPIIAITAHAMSGFREKCLELGMNDFLSKPFFPEDMLLLISKHISSKNNESTLPSEDKMPEKGSNGPDQMDPGQLKGIDGDRALKNLMGNGKLLIKLLMEFCQTFNQAPAQIEAALVAGDTATAHLLAHSIKGTAGNLGALELSGAASELEKAIRENRAEPAGLEYEDFCKALNTVLGNYAYIYELDRASNSELYLHTKKDHGQTEDLEVLRNTIFTLREMIKEHSFDAGNYAREHLAGNYVLEQEKLRDLIRAIEDFDYDKALLLLEILESDLT